MVTGGLLEVNNSTLAPLVEPISGVCFCVWDELREDTKECATVDELGKKLLNLLGVVFALVLLAFTASQTYALLLEVSGNATTAAIGLALFEGGMIYWWYVFQRGAEGLFQMAIALLMFVLCLGLVIVATALKLGAVDVNLLGQATPAKVITVAVLLQLTAKLLFPLVAPETFNQITERANEGKIMAKAQRLFSAKHDAIANDVADDMAELWLERARVQTVGDWQTRLNKRLPTGEREPALLEKSLESSPSANGANPTRAANGR